MLAASRKRHVESATYPLLIVSSMYGGSALLTLYDLKTVHFLCSWCFYLLLSCIIDDKGCDQYCFICYNLKCFIWAHCSYIIGSNSCVAQRNEIVTNIYNLEHLQEQRTDLQNKRREIEELCTACCSSINENSEFQLFSRW